MKKLSTAKLYTKCKSSLRENFITDTSIFIIIITLQNTNKTKTESVRENQLSAKGCALIWELATESQGYTTHQEEKSEPVKETKGEWPDKYEENEESGVPEAN